MAELVASVSEPGIFIAHRVIAEADEGALLPGESRSFCNSSPKARRQSGAARIAAHRLLEKLGYQGHAIAKAASGAPVWPRGVVGSLAHDERVAVAALARAQDFASVGVDIEPAEDLPDELIESVASPAERARYPLDVLRSRQLFVAKEAAYKAAHVLDGIFLEHHDIEVNLERQVATMRYGRSLFVRVKTADHVMALAFVRASRPEDV